MFQTVTSHVSQDVGVNKIVLLNMEAAAMQNSNECSFDRELRATVEKYSNAGLLSAGEIIAVMEVVKHATIHAAENAAADTEVDNFTSTNSAGVAPTTSAMDKIAAELNEAIGHICGGTYEQGIGHINEALRLLRQ